MKIDEIKLKETTSGATGAGSIAVVASPIGEPISRTGTKKKSKKNKNPHGIEMPKNSLFASIEEGWGRTKGRVAKSFLDDPLFRKITGRKSLRDIEKDKKEKDKEKENESTKPKYKNKQVKGKDPTPAKSKPTSGHESPHPFRGKLVGEDTVNKTSLPSHLAKFFDPDGNLKPEVSKRMSKNKDYEIKDVTPKGYGPGNHYEIGGDRYDGGIVFKVYIGGDEVHSDIIDGDHPYVYNGKKYDGVKKALDAIAKDNGLDNADDFDRVEMESHNGHTPGPTLADLSHQFLDLWQENHRPDNWKDELVDFVKDKVENKDEWNYVANMINSFIEQRKAHFDKRRSGGNASSLMGMTYKDESMDESTSDEAWELLGQEDSAIQGYVAKLGLKNDEESVKKVVPIIDQAKTITITADQIAKLKNLANKGAKDKKALSDIIKLKDTGGDVTGQFGKIMQARDAGEKRDRGYDVSTLINAINSGSYDPPVVLKAKDGYHVVGGRTRMYAALALNKPIKVKAIDASAPVQEGKMKELDMDLKDKDMSDADFKKKYGKDRAYYFQQMQNDVKEGSIRNDMRAGIKWAKDADWAALHNMDIRMIKDYIKHKEEAEDISWRLPEANDFDFDAEIASYGDDNDEDESMSDAPYAIIWHGQYAEWYGSGDPDSGEGRYKMKGDAGSVLAKNIPTYEQAEKLLPRVIGMGHVGDRGKWGKDHSVVMQSSDPIIIPMKELGDHFYSYDSDMQKYGDVGNDDHHDVIDLGERKLSGNEKKNKEHNVKKLKKHKKSFSKYGKDADSVMYAVATRDAKKGKKYK